MITEDVKKAYPSYILPEDRESNAAHPRYLPPEDRAKHNEAKELVDNIRNETHGNFADNARIATDLRHVLKLDSPKTNMSFVQSEALTMIATKLSRICSGNPNVDEHWLDIQGYCQLVRNEIATRDAK